MESHILAGGNKRTCSQRLFNFLLTKFEKDRDYTEFCDLIKMLMDFVYLRTNVDKLREGLFKLYNTSVFIRFVIWVMNFPRLFLQDVGLYHFYYIALINVFIIASLVDVWAYPGVLLHTHKVVLSPFIPLN